MPPNPGRLLLPGGSPNNLVFIFHRNGNLCVFWIILIIFSVLLYKLLGDSPYSIKLFSLRYGLGTPTLNFFAQHRFADFWNLVSTFSFAWFTLFVAPLSPMCYRFREGYNRRRKVGCNRRQDGCNRLHMSPVPRGVQPAPMSGATGSTCGGTTSHVDFCFLLSEKKFGGGG